MRTTDRYRAVALPLALAAVSWVGVPPATAEECSHPCTVTRNGLPTLRLINTANSDSWDLESSAFGLELIGVGNDTPAAGAFRVEDGADANTLVIDDSGRVGIGTTAPATELQINDTAPQIRLNDITTGQGQVDLLMSDNRFIIQGNSGALNLMQIDTRAPFTVFTIDEGGSVGIGRSSPEAFLHVGGDARIEGDFAIASSRTLKTGFESVSSAEILAKVADLPVASWRYQTENETDRHIGPFAEDFQRLFGLGDGETISVIDAHGVAFAAIQGLQQELAKKEIELRELRSERDTQIAELNELLTAKSDELTARLMAVEERLDAR